jgi:hypothetical protein
MVQACMHGAGQGLRPGRPRHARDGARVYAVRRARVREVGEPACTSVREEAV